MTLGYPHMKINSAGRAKNEIMKAKYDCDLMEKWK